MVRQSLHTNSRRLAAAVSAILGAAAPGWVRAQTDTAVVAEVVVTATRRTERIQDVPLNIAAFDGEQIQAQGVGDLAEVARFVPGLFVLDQGARAANAIVVRGLNADPIGGTEALNNGGGGTVATYVGEIPLYVDLKPQDMERVEVLLGPQGTLYGAGTLGGAIRYIPRRPQFDATTVEVRAASYTLSQSDGIGADGGFTLNLPLSETFALRASVDYLDDPGFIDYNYLVRESGVSDPEPDFTDPAAVAANLRRQKDVDDEQTLSGRIGVRWRPGDKLDVNLTYYYQDQDVGGRTLNQRTSFGTGRYDSAQRYVEPNERKNELLALEITADLGFAELTSATGASRYKDLGQRDQTDLLITLEYGYEAFPSFSAFTRDSEEDETFTQEVRLVSVSEGPFNWIAGVFYNHYKNDNVSAEFTPHYDVYLAGEPSLRPDALEYYAVANTRRNEKAVYGELSYDLTEKWQVTVGGRWYKYDQKSKVATDLPLSESVFNGRAPDSLVLEFNDSGQGDEGSLFKFNTSYDFTDDVMGYLTVSEGYRIGDANGLSLCEPVPEGEEPSQNVCASEREFQYFPDSTTNYEIGLRTQWLNRRLTINGSLFYIDWQDPQLATATLIGQAPIRINGNGAKSQGGELSFNAQLTDRFSIRASYSYTQAELTEDTPHLVRTIEPPGFGATLDEAFDGDRLPGSPEHQGSLYATYTLPISSAWELGLNYGVAAISDVFTRIGNRGGGEALPGFALHSASVVLSNDAWTVALYAKNLFNKYAETGVRTTPLYLQTVTDENGESVHVRSYSKDVVRPREVGLRATYKFDL